MSIRQKQIQSRRCGNCGSERIQIGEAMWAEHGECLECGAVNRVKR